MSQSTHEIAKELTIAAIQSGAITKTTSIDKTADELNKINAQEIGKFYKAINKAVTDAFNGRYD